MTTPLIPTKVLLNQTTFIPEELAKDAELETWLINLQGFEVVNPDSDPPTVRVYSEGMLFIQALLTAYRTGSATEYSTNASWKSFTFEFTTYGGQTKNQKANYIASAIGASTKYKYTITGPSGPSEGDITVSWE